MDLFEILQGEQGDLILAARIAAIPNSFDAGLLAALLASSQPIQADLDTLNEVGLLTVHEGERFAVHPLFRRQLLETWWTDVPAFRSRCKLGYEHLSSQYGQADAETSLSALQELAYFALGADLPAGLELLETVYVSARNRYQLGVCEQLLFSVQVLEPVLSRSELEALHYFQADLALAYYKLEEAERGLNALANETADPLRKALATLGLGRVHLAQHRWQLAFTKLHQAEDMLADLRQPYYRAVAQAAIGSTYDDLAERSGGLYSGNEDRPDPLIRFQRSMDGIPFAVLRALLRTPPFSSLYFSLGLNPRSRLGRVLTALYIGSSYQDWVIARLKVEAARWLGMAAATFESLNRGRELADADDLLIVLYQQLGHPRQARRLQEALLTNQSVQHSEYWQARVRLVRGHVRAEAGQWVEALNDLNPAYQVMARYADWDRAGVAAQVGGQVRSRMGNVQGAAVAFRDAAEDFQRAQDLLRRTEALVALSEVSKKPIPQRETLGFIDRFPGDLHKRIRRSALLSVNGLTWLGALMIILWVGVIASIIEAAIYFPLHKTSLKVSLFDVVQLVIGLSLPFLMIWGYRIVYTIVGGAVWAYRLPIGTIEADAPQIIVLDESQVLRQNLVGEQIKGIRWADVLGWISAERQLIRRVVQLGSGISAVTHDQVFTIQATTRFYKALKARLLSQQPQTSRRLSVNLDYVRSWWFIALVIFSIALGWFTPPAHAVPNTCRDPRLCKDQIVNLYLMTRVTGTLVVLTVLLPLVISIRHHLQRRRVERLVHQLRRS